MYYLDHDGAIVPTALESLPGNVPASRMFATVAGASRHPDAVPVTAISMKTEPTYDGREIIENGWRVDGLTPNGYCTLITIEN